MGTLKPSLHPINPIECLDMCPIWDGLLPLDELFIESMIQYDLLMDVDSVVIKSNPNFLSESDPSIDQSSYVSIVESLEYPIEQQVNDPT